MSQSIQICTREMQVLVLGLIKSGIGASLVIICTKNIKKQVNNFLRISVYMA